MHAYHSRCIKPAEVNEVAEAHAVETPVGRIELMPGGGERADWAAAPVTHCAGSGVSRGQCRGEPASAPELKHWVEKG